MDGDFMDELNIAFIGINYIIGGNYPTHYGICYHFYNVQEEKDIRIYIFEIYRNSKEIFYGI